MERLYSYYPEPHKLKEINKFIKVERFMNLFVTIFWNGCLIYSISSTSLDFRDGKELLFKIMLVAGGLISIINTIRLFHLSIGTLSFSEGKIVDTCCKKIKKHPLPNYYATIEQPDGNILENVLIRMDLHGKEDLEVIIVYDDKIRYVFPKNEEMPIIVG